MLTRADENITKKDISRQLLIQVISRLLF